MQQFILSNRPVRQNIETKPAACDVQKADLIGAYRHPGKISGEIAACGINLKQLPAVLVCTILTTIHCAYCNFVESVSTY